MTPQLLLLLLLIAAGIVGYVVWGRKEEEAPPGVPPTPPVAPTPGPTGVYLLAKKQVVVIPVTVVEKIVWMLAEAQRIVTPVLEPVPITHILATETREVVPAVAPPPAVVKILATEQRIIKPMAERYVVKVDSDPLLGGWIVQTPDETNYALGAIVKLEAKANAVLGYYFDHWTDNGDFLSISNPINYVVTHEATVTAHFKRD